MGKLKSDKTAPASLKWATYFLSTLLTFLIIWLLGFFLSDIGDLKGPDLQEVTQRHVDQNLVDRSTELQSQIRGIDSQIRRQREIQENLRQSMDNARATMEQMMSLHRLSLEQKVAPSDVDSEALATSQQRFLEAQNRFEEANREITNSSEQKYELNEELKSVTEQIELQRKPAREEFNRLVQSHRLKVASFKLAFIVPLFLLAAWLVYRFRESAYRTLFVSVLIASFWKVGTVMFDHFPRDFFKYIAILSAILIVVVFLIWVLIKAVRPGAETLLKRYREAYANHHCPICVYPIARGILKQAVWTRKGPKLVGTAAEMSESSLGSPYACPSCGTPLYEKCDKCEIQRHSLLPFCEHCGNEKQVSTLVTDS